MLYLMMTEMFSMPDHVPPLFKTSAENTFPMKKKKKKNQSSERRQKNSSASSQTSLCFTHPTAVSQNFLSL